MPKEIGGDDSVRERDRRRPLGRDARLDRGDAARDPRGVDGGNVACFRADAEHGCRLASTRQRGGPHGGGARIYEDFEGRRVVRVTERERRCTLRFGDGEALHLEAVVNEDGCRLATRSELGRGSGLSTALHALLRRG